MYRSGIIRPPYMNRIHGRTKLFILDRHGVGYTVSPPPPFTQLFHIDDSLQCSACFAQIFSGREVMDAWSGNYSLWRDTVCSLMTCRLSSVSRARHELAGQNNAKTFSVQRSATNRPSSLASRVFNNKIHCSTVLQRSTPYHERSNLPGVTCADVASHVDSSRPAT